MPYSDIRPHTGGQYSQNTNDSILVRDYSVRFSFELYFDNKKVWADAFSALTSLRCQIEENVRVGGGGADNIIDLGMEWVRGYPIRNGMGVSPRQPDGFLWDNADHNRGG